VTNVSSVNEYIKNTVVKVKQHYNMKESGKKRQQQVVLMELSPGKHRFRCYSSKKG